MKVYLAADHAGFELKEKIKVWLVQNNYEVEDFGALAFDPQDDYPDYIKLAAEAVAKDQENNPAIVIGGSGQGEGMVANRYNGVRAIVYYGPRSAVAAVNVAGKQSVDPLEIIRLSREHNHANVLAIGARFVRADEALAAIKLWLETPFNIEERHQRRIDKF
ncbi:MAG: RpiB/LacA/LacB family sugar-phosphate isomerase [bacterium]|nr:RpiB/LacA/LacB family sugar-phosphate isomerase [bacterium]